MELTAEEMLDAVRRDWPREYEITGLRLLNDALAARLGKLEPSETPAEQSEAYPVEQY